MGFKPNSNALEYGGGHSYNKRAQGGMANERRAEARGLGIPEPNDQMRGHYIPRQVHA